MPLPRPTAPNKQQCTGCTLEDEAFDRVLNTSDVLDKTVLDERSCSLDRGPLALDGLLPSEIRAERLDTKGRRLARPHSACGAQAQVCSKLRQAPLPQLETTLQKKNVRSS